MLANFFLWLQLWAITKKIQRNIESLFVLLLSLSCSRLQHYSFDANADTSGGLRMDAPSQLLRLSIILIGIGVVIWYFV